MFSLEPSWMLADKKRRALAEKRLAADNTFALFYGDTIDEIVEIVTAFNPLDTTNDLMIYTFFRMVNFKAKRVKFCVVIFGDRSRLSPMNISNLGFNDKLVQLKASYDAQINANRF